MTYTAKKILCPTDLSQNSLEINRLATTLALASEGEIVFLYVAPPALPESSGQAIREYEAQIKRETEQFMNIRPLDDRVSYQNIVIRGKAGETIVQQAAELDCDMIIMCTHGRTGFQRFWMGSVTEHVIRHAKCPVMSIRHSKPKDSTGNPEKANPESSREQTVAEIMHSIEPVKGFDKMDDVLEGLDKENETAVPVIDDVGHCIGILTLTDIQRYDARRKQLRGANANQLDAELCIDEDGVHIELDPFDEVHRHMSMPVVTVSAGATLHQAKQLFVDKPNIHHLVVVDEKNRPVGVLDTFDALRVNKEVANS